MKRKRKSKWTPPAEWLQPVDAEEFKFCFALQGAAVSGNMAVPKPKPLRIVGIGEVSVTNTPFNRGMLAVSKHLHDIYPHTAGEGPWQAMAIPFRLMMFGDFLVECFQSKHPDFEPFLRRNEDTSVEINEALVDAAAKARVVGEGFETASLLSIAQASFAEAEEKESK